MTKYGVKSIRHVTSRAQVQSSVTPLSRSLHAARCIARIISDHRNQASLKPNAQRKTELNSTELN